MNILDLLRGANVRLTIINDDICNLITKRKTSFNNSKESYANAQLKNKCNGKKCYILGNGPSLLQEDLTRLSGECVFTVNSFYRNRELCEMIKPSFHFVFDPLYFDSKNEDVFLQKERDVILEMAKNCSMQIVAPYYAKDFIHNTLLWDKYSDITYVDNSLTFRDKIDSFNIDEATYGFWCVVHYAIAFATYLGFREIYLLGVEQTNIISWLQGVAGRKSNCHAFDLSDDDLDAFNNLISFRPMDEYLDGYSKIFKQYRVLYKYCCEHDIKMASCTPNGLLKDIPFIPLEKTFVNDNNADNKMELPKEVNL